MKRIVIILLVFFLSFTSVFSQKNSFDTTKLKRWEFGGGIGVILCPMVLKDISKTINYEPKTIITPELNFYVYYNINRKWILQSGLGFSILKYSFIYNGNFYKIDTATPQPISVPCAYNISMEYYRFSLPLYAAYNFSGLIHKNIDFYVKMGGSLNFTQKYHDKVFFTVDNEEKTYEFYPRFETRKLNPFRGYSDRPYNWEAGIFIGNKVHIKKIFLYYELGVSYGMRRLVCDSYFQSLYVKSTGLSLSSNFHICL